MTPLPLLADSTTPAADEVDEVDEPGLGCLQTEKGNLPLHAVQIGAHVTGLLAATTVRQTYRNGYPDPLEAIYVFPLPDRAAVTRFRLEVAGRVVEGDLQERAAARQAYAEAIAAGKRAGLAEEDRPNVFSVQVGNIPPGETVAVELTLAGPVAVDSGEATVRMPLVVAPRYIPGTPLPGDGAGDGWAPDTDSVPDASRITPPVLLPGFPNPVRLDISVTFDAPPANLRCSLPAEIDKTTVTVSPGQRLDRDFILRWDIGGDDLTTELHRTRDGVFALTLVPPTSAAPARPRDVVFVLDRSGSMAGWKMVAARRAVARMVDTLTTNDRVAVIAFDDRVDQSGGLVVATDRERFRHVEFLARLADRGGTEMLEPLLRAADLLSGVSDRERILVLATDGQVGNEDEILRRLAPKAAGVRGVAAKPGPADPKAPAALPGAELRTPESEPIRVFAVGIDTAVNDAFLRRIAALGGGAFELVESEDRLDEVMERLNRRIGSPVLTDIAISGPGLDRDTLAPARVPALYAGSTLLLTGYTAGSELRITGKDGTARPWSSTVVAATVDSAAIGPVWARARLRDLEDLYTVRSGNAELEAEIVRTSLAHNVLCRFTAFVAIDIVETVAADGTRRRIVQPVDAPAGWATFDQPPDALFEMAPGAAPASFTTMAAQPAPTSIGPPAGARTLHAPSPIADHNATELPQIDLTPYRRRAAELLARGDEDGRLVAELALLIADLRSVEVDRELLEPLERLLEELAAATPPLFGTIDMSVLRRFADGTDGTGEPDRPANKLKKDRFWART